ncbi:MAG: phosphopentomutase [Clostridiales bacterium]|nr:phosphopentomutase [Clostridiales bacterium]
MKRVFLIVLDSFGVGELPDAADYGDEGSNTLGTVCKNQHFSMPNMTAMGLFNLDGVKGVCGQGVAAPTGAYCRLNEASAGKDTTTGHWEIAGLISEKHLPLFPDGFPDEIIKKFEEMTGRKVLVNKPYSGTEVIKDYGGEHMKTGALIVYTSADSVFQVAAHEDIVPVEQLYEYCRMAREMLVGDYGVGRVIARPFIGEPGNFTRTSRRHDFSLVPPGDTMLDQLKDAGLAAIGVGKINDIFAGKGITEFVRTSGNPEGIERTLEYMDKDFEGLCFVNLVDFDMLYGHRNDADGYAKALTYFDERLPQITAKLRTEDILMITADHGCDPGTPSTDHSREYIPLVMYGQPVPTGTNFGTRSTYADIGATVLHYFGIESHIAGETLF